MSYILWLLSTFLVFGGEKEREENDTIRSESEFEFRKRKNKPVILFEAT